MNSIQKLFVCFAFSLLLVGCEEPEKAIKAISFLGNGDKTLVAYYQNEIYLDFDTEKNGYYSDYTIVFTDTTTGENVYTLNGKCRKYYYCYEHISYNSFPESGEFKGIATLETGASAEFTVSLPVVTEQNETKPN